MSLHQLRRRLAAYAKSERGASASEYALLLMIITGCLVVTLGRLGGHINAVVARVAGALGGH